MAIVGLKGASFCSFFLINGELNLVDFHIDSSQEIQEFLANEPTVGGNVVELIAQAYRHEFVVAANNAFEGRCFVIDKNLPLPEHPNFAFQLIFTPIVTDYSELLVACTLVTQRSDFGPLKILSDYSQLTSHQLRAPITNILSLSNISNYTRIDSYDASKIDQLLADINFQAGKLDDIIITLNTLLNQNMNPESFEQEYIKTRKHRVVLIDDDVITNKIHYKLIKRVHSEKEIVLFSDPGEALSFLKQDSPDLILLDLNMPEIDGWEFLKLMEENGIKIDVIIVSSSIDPRERSKAKQYSFVKDFITKPLTQDKVKLMFNH